MATSLALCLSMCLAIALLYVFTRTKTAFWWWPEYGLCLTSLFDGGTTFSVAEVDLLEGKHRLSIIIDGNEILVDGDVDEDWLRSLGFSCKDGNWVKDFEGGYVEIGPAEVRVNNCCLRKCATSICFDGRVTIEIPTTGSAIRGALGEPPGISEHVGIFH